MQRYLQYKIIRDSGASVMREGKDTVTNNKVNIVTLVTSDGATLRKYQEEVDTQRNMRSQYSIKILEVDLNVDGGNLWRLDIVREHCQHNLAAEIRRRRDMQMPWSDENAWTAVSHMIQALAEVQTLGYCYKNISLKGILVRKSGELILGSYDHILHTKDSNKYFESAQRLVLILTHMMLLQPEDVAQRDWERFFMSADLTNYPKVKMMIETINCRNPQRDFVQLQQAIDSGSMVQRQSLPQLLPQINFAAPAMRVDSLPARLVSQQIEPMAKRCASCNQVFQEPSFNPRALRSEYQKYPNYLEKVCSLSCLDTYIKYLDTIPVNKSQEPPQETCMMCTKPFLLADGWRAAEKSPLRNSVCSRGCLINAHASFSS